MDPQRANRLWLALEGSGEHQGTVESGTEADLQFTDKSDAFQSLRPTETDNGEI